MEEPRTKNQLVIVTQNKQDNLSAVVLKRLRKDTKSQLDGNFAHTVFFFCFHFSLQERIRNLWIEEIANVFIFPDSDKWVFTDVCKFFSRSVSVQVLKCQPMKSF